MPRGDAPDAARKQIATTAPVPRQSSPPSPRRATPPPLLASWRALAGWPPNRFIQALDPAAESALDDAPLPAGSPAEFAPAHIQPTPLSDRRPDNSAPASRHPAGPSSPGFTGIKVGAITSHATPIRVSLPVQYVTGRPGFVAHPQLSSLTSQLLDQLPDGLRLVRDRLPTLPSLPAPLRPPRSSSRAHPSPHAIRYSFS